jgi:hypothetical protein
MKKQAKTLKRVQSESRENVFYEIRLGADDNIYCTCPAWKFQRKGVFARSCKHLVAWAKEVGAARAARVFSVDIDSMAR